MRIYLDACCLSRPLDDQTQQRIRIESEAVRLVLELCAQGSHRWVSSEVVEAEVSRNPDQDHREVVLGLLTYADERLVADERSVERARGLASHGLGAVDALHLALAEGSACDMLLTTDDDFIRRARGLRPATKVRVENPARWVMENAQDGA